MSLHASPGRPTARSNELARTLRRLRARAQDDTGSATAEYAVVILAAVAFAGVLVALMRSGEIQSLLGDLVRGALTL